MVKYGIEDLIEVKLPDEESFLIVKETLTRIGIASSKNKTLTQSCHILQKQGKMYIVHFLEMFLLDGKRSEISEDDIGRRNSIISLLEDWELIRVVEPSRIESPRSPMYRIKVLSHKEKNEWQLIEKYQIGNKRK